jgi:hypothetical protein
MANFELLDVTLTFAEGPRVDAAGCDDLREHLVRLTDAIRMHNLREEALLRDLIPSADAWGPTRAEIMIEEHIQEHDRLCAALLGIPCTPPEFAAAGIAALVGLIGEHMDREEAAFLGLGRCASSRVASWFPPHPQRTKLRALVRRSVANATRWGHETQDEL